MISFAEQCDLSKKEEIDFRPVSTQENQVNGIEPSTKWS
jgi:hypothetical protein